MSDHENRFFEFLQPIRDLASNWDIDIAESLENYLDELENLSVTFDVTRNKDLNFAEAALLIQGSTAIYSKKVEYLHQLVIQALSLITNQKSKVNEKDNENNGKVSKLKGVSSSVLDDERILFGNDPTYLLLDDIIEEGNNIDLVIDAKSIKDRRRSSGRHSISADISRVSMVLMHSIMQEDHGGTSLKMSTCQMDTSGALIIGGQLAQNTNLFRNSIGVNSSLHNDIYHNQDDIHIMDDDNNDDLVYNDAYDVDARDNQETINNLNDGNNYTKAVLTKKVVLKTRPKEVKNSVLQLLDPHDVQKGSKSVKKGRPYLVPSQLLKNTNEKLSNQLVHVPLLLSMKSMSAKIFDSLIDGNVPLTGIAHCHFNDIIKTQKAEKMKNIRNMKKNTEVFEEEYMYTDANDEENDRHVNNTDDNNEVYNNYEDHANWNDAGDDDDHFNPNPMDNNENIINNEISALEIIDNMLPYDGHASETAAALAKILADEEELARRVENALNEGLNQSATSSYEVLCRKYIDNFMRGAENFARETNLSKRVKEWTNKLEPKLKEQEEAPQFDIHQYSDKILNRVSGLTADTNDTSNIPFYEVVKDQSPAEVCRLFLACLQLANLGNINVLPNSDPSKVNSIPATTNSKNKSNRIIEDNDMKNNENIGASNMFLSGFQLQLLSNNRKKIDDFPVKVKI